MYRLKLSFFLKVTVCLLTFSYSTADLYSEEQADIGADKYCLLNVGMVDWRPYQYFLDSGGVGGIQIELLEEIARNAECKLNYVYSKPTDSIVQIKTGKIDMIISATKTKNREEFAYFSVPYRNEMLVLYSTAKYADSCNKNSLVELIDSGFRLGLQAGSVYGELAVEIQSNAELNKKIRYFKHITPSQEFMQENELDGVFGDPFSISFQAKLNDNFKHLHWCRKTMSTSPVSLMFSKKTVSKSTVDKFNKAIETVKETDLYRSNWIWVNR